MRRQGRDCAVSPYVQPWEPCGTSANEAPAPTERWTLHIEKPFIARIKAEAEAEHVTVTEIINRIIRHYYAGG